MRHSVSVIFCLTLVVQTAHSQLTLTPRIGFENANTRVKINDGSFFTPLSNQFSPQAGLRLDYRFKSGHGMYTGLSAGNTTVAFSFTNPEESFRNYFSSKPRTQFCLEGGYRFDSKPILLNQESKTQKTQKKNCNKSESSMKQGCGSYMRSMAQCGKPKEEIVKQRVKKEMLFVRLQPQLGLAYIPSVKNDFAAKAEGAQTTYTYYAGNWNTALTGGMGFELGKGKKKLFQVNLQYLKGIGNLGNETLTTESGNKSVETKYASRASAWNLTFGVPVSFTKKPAAKKKTQQKNHCEQIRSRCGGMRRI